MKRWLMLLLTSFALLLPASQATARDIYILPNGGLIWLGSGPPDQPPPSGYSNWVWLGWCWGAFWVSG